MSKKNRRENQAPLSYQGKDPPRTYTVALKPRPKLLLVAAILFGLWVAALLALYFFTIYSARK